MIRSSWQTRIFHQTSKPSCGAWSLRRGWSRSWGRRIRRFNEGGTKRGGQPRSWPFSFLSPSYDHPNKDETMNEDDEITQLNKFIGRIRVTIEEVDASTPPPQSQPDPRQRNLLKEWIAQAKAEIAERAKGLEGAERGRLVARIYRHHLRVKIR